MTASPPASSLSLGENRVYFGLWCPEPRPPRN
jgi:hypothetical protein